MMLSLKVAWRFYRGGERGGLVSLIAGVSTTGMTLAVALLIVVLSVMNGFEREFKQRILGLVPHANLQLWEPLKDWEPLVARITDYKEILSVQPYNQFQAMGIRGREVVPVLVQGIQLEDRFAQLGNYLFSLDSSSSANLPRLTSAFSLSDGEAIVGKVLAQKLNLTHGGKLRLLKAENDPNGQRSRRRSDVVTLTVVAVLDTGTQIDKHLAVINLATSSQILGIDGAIQGLHFQTRDLFSARQNVYQLAQDLDLFGSVSDWSSEYGNLYLAIQLSRQLVVLLVASIIAVAVFNVFVTLGMVVRHKHREIAIIRTLGMTRRQLLRTFLWQGLFIALPGCLMGVLIGVSLALLIPYAADLLQTIAGIQILSTEIYPIDYLPSFVRPGDISLIVVTALGMSLIATLIPAWRASRMRPVTVLNREQ